MSARTFLRENWRLLVLLVLLALSVYALFVPGGVMGGDDPGLPDEAAGNESVQDDRENRLTNLAFGLGLDGGARISAPPVGMVVDGLELDTSSGDPGGDLEDAMVDELNLTPSDVNVQFDEDSGLYTVEIFTDEVSESEFAAVLSEQGLDVDSNDVDPGVTEETRSHMIRVIDDRVNAAGLDGGRVRDAAGIGDRHYIITEAPAMTVPELRDLLQDRGTVEIWASYPDPDGDGRINETVLEGEDFENIDYPESRGDEWVVPVEVSDQKAPEYEQRMNEIGFTSEGVDQCPSEVYQDGDVNFESGDEWCLLTVSDGEVVSAHSLSDRSIGGGPGLATSMRQGEWSNDPSFTMSTRVQEDAFSLSVNLRAGALPAPLDFDDAQEFSIRPALAEQFKSFSLIIGLLSVLAVSGVVFARYRDPRVAAPMVLTATSEVVVLLGFAAAISMPLDLAHVAGFIAVVGTGVDDLIIIADEVMSEGDVNQAKIFDSRFKKAFWVIGAAAATTIIAMSPLAVLGLGDLQGFAIVTILGVLVGVFVTRPAYGDILRRLLVDER